jgi:hypothetical protein
MTGLRGRLDEHHFSLLLCVSRYPDASPAGLGRPFAYLFPGEERGYDACMIGDDGGLMIGDDDGGWREDSSCRNKVSGEIVHLYCTVVYNCIFRELKENYLLQSVFISIYRYCARVTMPRLRVH